MVGDGEETESWERQNTTGDVECRRKTAFVGDVLRTELGMEEGRGS